VKLKTKKKLLLHSLFNSLVLSIDKTSANKPTDNIRLQKTDALMKTQNNITVFGSVKANQLRTLRKKTGVQ